MVEVSMVQHESVSTDGHGSTGGLGFTCARSGTSRKHHQLHPNWAMTLPITYTC